MGFGAGMAGFMNGLANGMSLARQYNEADKEYQIRKVREQGIAEAKAMQAAATPKVTDNGDMQNLTSRPQASADPALKAPQQGDTIEQALGQQQPNAPTEFARSIPPEQAPLSSTPMASQDPKAAPMAQGFTPAPVKRFTVGGKEVDTQAQASKIVQDETPDIETFYAKTLVPRMKEAYMAQGKPEQAEAWQKYADDTKTKGHMRDWATAFQYAQVGKYTEAAKSLMKLHPDFDDGLELVSSEATTGPDGQEGFTMVLRGEDGKEQKVYHDAKTITEMGLAQLSPVEMFNKRFALQQQADLLKARAVIDETNDLRTSKRQADGIAGRAANKKSEMETKAEQDKKRDEAKEAAKMERLKESHRLRLTEIAERNVAKSGAKKSDSPEAVRKAAIGMASRDPMWATMDEGERKEAADFMVEYIKGEGGAAAPAAGGIANPFEASPAPSSSAPKKGGIPVYRNGKIEYTNR